MELASDLSAEQLPVSSEGGSLISFVQSDGALSNLTGGTDKIQSERLKNLSEEEITEKVENILLERIQEGNNDALFQLGQLYFEEKLYDKAKRYFEKAAEKGDFQAMFQLGVINYDGLTGKPDHKLGVEWMQKVVAATCPQAAHLQWAARYNIGRAYYQGFGLNHDDEQAERFWLLAANDGDPKASIKAQSMLGMFYCRDDTRNLKKAFFWHSEACGNGSLESQGALGVMYQYGLGVKRDMNSAFVCLREAAERGNVYAMGNLVAYYYNRKLHTKTVELAARVSLFEDPDQIGLEMDCLPGYVAKGIALACFYYARCLHLGLGVKKDEEEAKKYYSKCYHFDPDTCATLQNTVAQGQI